MIDVLMQVLRAHAVQARLDRSSAERAIYYATVRNRDEARAKLADLAAEAALAGNPARACYYDEWGQRT